MLLQDYYWTFCSQLWANKEVTESNKEVTESNILAEAHSGAKAYLDQIRRTGII